MYNKYFNANTLNQFVKMARLIYNIILSTVIEFTYLAGNSITNIYCFLIREKH